jgi:hypothetical protein
MLNPPLVAFSYFFGLNKDKEPVQPNNGWKKTNKCFFPAFLGLFPLQTEGMWLDNDERFFTIPNWLF